MNLPVDIVRLIKTFVRHDPKENMKLCLAAIGWNVKDGHGEFMYRNDKKIMTDFSSKLKKLQRLGVNFSCDLHTVIKFESFRFWDLRGLEDYRASRGDFTASGIIHHFRNERGF